MNRKKLTDDELAAPGISLSKLIGIMNRQSLENLLGENVIATLTTLSDNNNLEESTLKKVAEEMCKNDGRTFIQNTGPFSCFIDALPLQKAQELSQNLRIHKKGNPYHALKDVDLRQHQSLLCSFFGIAKKDEFARFSRNDDRKSVEPCYGLFEHQRDVVLRTLQKIKHEPHKLLVHMPTGSGKTRMAMHIIARHFLERGSTLVCWLANSAELLEQAADDFENSWNHLGDRPLSLFRFWGNRNIDITKVREGLLIAGFQKLQASYNKDQNSVIALGDYASLTIVDEAHQATAPTYRSIIEALYTKQPQNALIGLTATPGRTWNDIAADASLSDFFGKKKITLDVEGYADPISFLVQEKYLAKTTFRRIEFSNNFNFTDEQLYAIQRSGDYEDILSMNNQRNTQIIQAIENLLERHRRVLVFSASVSHAKLITAILIARNHEALVVTASTPLPTRERTIRKFKSNRETPLVLCNYGVLTTGFDAPQTSAAVIARPTKSLVLYSQMVGRVTRGPKAGGNNNAEVVTVADTNLPGFGSVVDAFYNWEDVWNG